MHFDLIVNDEARLGQKSHTESVKSKNGPLDRPKTLAKPEDFNYLFGTIDNVQSVI